MHLAARLTEAGAGPESVVGVLVNRSCALPVAFTAVSATGAGFLCLNPNWPANEREALFNRFRNRIVLCWSGSEEDSTQFAEKTVEFGPEDLESPILEPGERLSVPPGADFYLNATSGSTGLPKIAATTHEQLLANTSGVSTAMGLTEDDVLMSLFGVIGHPHELFMRGLWLGARTVLIPGVYPRQHVEAVTRHRVTFLMGLPPQLESFARLSDRDDADISSLRVVEAGGMHVNERFMEVFRRGTGVPVTPVWGSTETSGVALVGNPGEPGLTRPVPGYSMLLRDEDGEPVDEGRGELWISGPGLASRYMGDRVLTAQLFQDGWYRSGDIFSLADGRLHFVGRRGGMIKPAGLKLYPTEVELVLLLHPEVRDVCVVGEERTQRGETPVAYVVTSPGSTLTAPDLRSFLTDRLEDFKIPRDFRFVLGLPRTSSGKLDRGRVGTAEVEPDYRGELLRLDVDLVRLLNTRAVLMEGIGAGFDPNWLEEQVNSAIGHNAGPVSDSVLREIIRVLSNTLLKG
jgi:long-chain acyl-CoA synthetase